MTPRLNTRPAMSSAMSFESRDVSVGSPRLRRRSQQLNTFQEAVDALCRAHERELQHARGQSGHSGLSGQREPMTVSHLATSNSLFAANSSVMVGSIAMRSEAGSLITSSVTTHEKALEGYLSPRGTQSFDVNSKFSEDDISQWHVDDNYTAGRSGILLSENPTQRWRRLTELLQAGVRVEQRRQFHVLPHWQYAGWASSMIEGIGRTKFAAWVDRRALPQRKQLRVTFQETISARAGDHMLEDSILNHLVMTPNSPFRLLWVTLGLLFLLWDGLTIPLQVFPLGSLGDTIQASSLVVMCYWSLDIPLQLFCGYRTADAVMEMRPAAIRKNYLKTRFWFDFPILSLDLLIYFLIDTPTTSSDPTVEGASAQAGALSVRLTRLTRLLRFIRLMRAKRLKECFHALTERLASQNLLLAVNLAKYVFLILFLNHYVACGWYAMASYAQTQPRHWIDAYNVDDGDDLYAYTLAIHWSLTQFSPSTNNIVPTNFPERVYASLVTLLAMLVFSSFVSGVTNSVNQIRLVNVEGLLEEAKIRDYMVARGISTELFARIQNFFKHSYKKKKKRLREEDMGFFSELPETLLIELHLEVYMDKILLHRVLNQFSYIDESFFKRICHQAMGDQYYLAGQDVFVDGNPARALYCFRSGEGSYVSSFDKKIFLPTTAASRGGDEEWTFTTSLSKLSRLDDEEMIITASGKLAGDDDDLVENDTWIAELALWVVWNHAGTLSATAASDVVKVHTQKVEAIVSDHMDFTILRCMRAMAVLTAYHLQKMESNGLAPTDLPLDDNDQLELADRAEKFTRVRLGLGMFREEPLPHPATSVSWLSKSTINPFTWRRGRSTKR